MKIGDIVTGYHKGYWRIVAITPRRYTHEFFKYSSYEEIEPGVYRYKYETQGAIPKVCRIGEEYSTIVTYQQVATADFRILPPRKQTKQCDASYCTVVTKQDIDRLAELYRIRLADMRRECLDENTN